MPQTRPSRPDVLRVVSLFSGIGGLDSGLELAGHEVIEMCESWEPARRVLAEHYPDVPIAQDVQSYTPGMEYDVLAAGFPCTDLSHAGGRTGIFGKSSGLVEHVFRIAEQTRPRWILLENVPNLLGLHSGAGMDHVIGELERLGYRWAYRTVDARFTGVPQRRPRVIILASPTADPSRVLLCEDAGAPAAPTDPDTAGFYWTEGRTGLGLVEDAIPTLKGGSTLGLPSAPAIWFRDRDRGHRLALPGIEDGEALQGLPRGWTAPAVVPDEPDLRWKLIGNAVPVGVGRWLGEALARHGRTAEQHCPVPHDGTVITRGKKWPQAGWGQDGTGYRSQVSQWPRREDMNPLAAVVRSPAPMSFRAAAGFLSRVEEAGRDIPDEFRRDVEDHLRLLRPRPKPSWASSPGSRRRMQKQKRANTKPELALRSLLHRDGLRYRLQVRPSPELRQRVDIAFMKEKVAVDVRGCFWHACPEHGTAPKANAQRWAEKLQRNVDRDERTRLTLTELGWEVMVVWEHEDPAVAATRIAEAVRSRRGAQEVATHPVAS
ncbi:DNA mismatch endonuclease Vsr [Janibacter sp. UYMM211]|uniref:DNA mismatch endonuclease Vsr n=1 Tax=Janibacter sp. UYMM211 TaxID=3156342 RepID=UPI00339214DB